MADEIDLVNAFFVEAFTPGHRDDPYRLYAAMRERGAVLSADAEIHLALGHEACWSILRNPSASSDERHSTELRRLAESDPRLAAVMGTRPLLVFMDPPEHTRLRNLVARSFTPSRVEQLRTDIERRTQALIDDLADHGGAGVDLIEHLAYPLPIGVMCDLLGIPASDRGLFRDWSVALTKSVDPGVLRSEADNEAIAQATAALKAYSGELLLHRRRHRGDDLLSELATSGSGDERLVDDELADLVVLLLVAGHETTVNLIGNGVVALLNHPDQLDDWRSHPEIGDTAVDELLRFDAPLQLVQRIALAPVRVGDRIVPVGDQVIVMVGSANRDPAEFAEPDRLDLRRPNASRHLSFGGGIHHCLGAALARTEGAVALGALVREFPRMEPAGVAPIRDTFTLRGRATLPVQLR